MTLYEHVMLQVRSGLSSIDADLDRARSFEARYGGGPGLDQYLEALAVERAQHLDVLQGLRELRRQQHPALLADVRPTRMAKASLRAGRRGALLSTGTEAAR